MKAFEDVFLVEMAQLDLGNILRLNLINAEAYHQVWHYLALLLGIPDNADGFINIEQYLFKPSQQMQPVGGSLEVECGPAAHAAAAELYPLAEQLTHPEHSRHSVDEDIEVAGERILERR